MNRLLFVALFSPLWLAAQVLVPGTLQHTVRAVGNATVTAKPDQARIAVGVTTQAATAEDAVQQDAEKTQAVFSALKGLIGGNGTLQTTNYSVAPQYKYDQGQPAVITGYEANHTVDVTLNDIALAGKVIDGATKAARMGSTGLNSRLKTTRRYGSGRLQKRRA